jgi:hypothetical protein
MPVWRTEQTAEDVVDLAKILRTCLPVDRKHATDERENALGRLGRYRVQRRKLPRRHQL